MGPRQPGLRAVGLGCGALYHYIGSKETLLYEIRKMQLDRMNTYAAELLARDLRAEERLEALRGLLAPTLEQGVRDGHFRAMPSLLIKGIVGMFNYTYLWFEPNGRISSHQLAGEFLERC